MDPITRLVHVLALAVYLGATVGLAVVFLPAAAAIEDPALQRRVLARGLRPYNVLSFAALLVALATGWTAITDLTAYLGAGFGQLLWLLVGKLSAVPADRAAGVVSSLARPSPVRAEAGGLRSSREAARCRMHARRRMAAVAPTRIA
jgi:hypothetical protein